MTGSWSSVHLGEVLKERREAPLPDALVRGDVPVVAKIGFNDGKIELRSDTKTNTGMILVRPGDLLVSGINAAKGAIAVYGEDNSGPIAATIHYGAYVPKKERVDVTYLWWLLRSRIFRHLLDTYVPGGIKTELKAKRLLPIPVSLPPLIEQRRIVTRIEELAAKIENARGLRHHASEEVEDLFASSSEAALNELLEHGTQPLREIVTVRGGGTPSKANPLYWDGPIPWISPKDMKGREISDSTDHITEDAIQNSSAKLLHPGAVLVVVRGMILAHTVPSAVLRTPAAINQDIKALIPGDELMPEYLCSALWALNHQIVVLVEKSTHDTRRLETSKLLDFAIPVPPMLQQQRIVGYLGALRAKVDGLKKLQAETSGELDALLPSILDRAFNGEL